MSLSSGSPGLILFWDAVEHGHEHGGEGQVRIAGAVRAAELEAFAGLVGRVHRDADGGRAIAPAVGEVDRGLVAGDQALVAVGGRVGEGTQGRGVPEQAADGVQGHVGQAGVARAGERFRAVLPQRGVDVHAGAVVAEERLGHERGRLVVPAGDVLDDVLVLEDVVGHLDQRREFHVDLALAAGGHLVVLGLDRRRRTRSS